MMALKKGVFEAYVKESKQTELDSYVNPRKYTHHKIFDSPLEVSEAPQFQNVLSSNKVDANKSSGIILDIDTNDIIRWKYKDRPENELGDIDELAETFKSVGQQQPCILRVSKEHQGKYELIIGERRWRAAEKAGLKLKAVVQDINDKTAALIQAIENEKRSDISEFAKGMSYSDKIEKGLLIQKDLTEILHISKQQVSRLLSFKKIPAPLFSALNDLSKISARTAEELVRLASKGNDYLNALIDLAPKISTGKFGGNSILKEVTNRINQIKSKPTNQKVLSKDGRHLFTWRLDNNSAPSIHFPKDIIQLLNTDTIKFDELTQEFKECIAKKLSSLQN